MTNREASSNLALVMRRLSAASATLRPGMILGIAVAGVVGLVGIVQWDQQLMITGLIAAVVIVALNAVVVASRYWHQRNTDPGEMYANAEDVVRLRSPKARR